MPPLQGNRKGLLPTGGGSEGFDYTDFTEFWSGEGTVGLIGENGFNVAEQGAVGSVAGKFGAGRGPCSGNSGGTPVGFQVVSDGSPFDTSVTTASFDKGSFIAWFKLGVNTGTQEIVAQGRPSDGSGRQFVCRGQWEDLHGAGKDGPALLIYDHALDNGTFQIGAAPATVDEIGTMPTGVWMMIGFSVNVTAERASMFIGIPEVGTFFDSRSMAGWDAFQASTAGVLTIGTGSGTGGAEPGGRDIDHITWWNGRELISTDFFNHWKGGQGLARSSYSSPPTVGSGGGFLHNGHGFGGNNHGAGGF